MLDQAALSLELLKSYRYDQISYHAAVSILAGMLWADGKLSKEEVSFVEELTQGGFSSMKPIIWKHDLWSNEAALKEEVKKIRNPRLRLILIDLLFFAAFADSHIAPEEESYLFRYMDAVGIKNQSNFKDYFNKKLEWFKHLESGAAMQLEMSHFQGEFLAQVEKSLPPQPKGEFA